MRPSPVTDAVSVVSPIRWQQSAKSSGLSSNLQPSGAKADALREEMEEAANRVEICRVPLALSYLTAAQSVNALVSLLVNRGSLVGVRILGNLALKCSDFCQEAGSWHMSMIPRDVCCSLHSWSQAPAWEDIWPQAPSLTAAGTRSGLRERRPVLFIHVQLQSLSFTTLFSLGRSPPTACSWSTITLCSQSSDTHSWPHSAIPVWLGESPACSHLPQLGESLPDPFPSSGSSLHSAHSLGMGRSGLLLTCRHRCWDELQSSFWLDVSCPGC